jgi:pullulanase
MNKNIYLQTRLRLAFKTTSRFFLLVVWLLTILAPLFPVQYAAAQTCSEATIHYSRRDSVYDGWGLHIWGPVVDTSVTWEAPLPPAGQDDFGVYWLVEMQDGAEYLNYIIHNGDEKDPGPDQQLVFAENGCEIWQVQGKDTQFVSLEEAASASVVTLSAAPPAGENQVLLHYRRSQEDYDGWGLHVWGPTVEQGITWTTPLMPDGLDDYGIYWLVDMEPGAAVLNYIVHKGDEKDPGPDQSLDIVALGREIWLIQGSGEQFLDPEIAKEAILAAGIGDIKNKAQAHWISIDTFAWPIEFGSKATFQLFYAPDGAIQVTQQGLSGGESITLEYAGDDLTPELAQKFPHLKTAVMLKIPQDDLQKVPELLRGQLAVSVSAPDGTILTATGVQIAGVLDDLYANDETLGVSFENNIPVVRLWAPTAKIVRLHLFDDSQSGTLSRPISMQFDSTTGVWSVTGDQSWIGLYYLYEVEVYVRQEGQIVTNLVTDPYSISLSTNSTRSQIIDLTDPALAPPGWSYLPKPGIAAPEDIVLYELHIRDFSAFDESVPAEQRGTYLAFTHPESTGMRHLQRLADAGLTHVHLLPAFDIATINENKTEWETADYTQLAEMPPDSDEQQAILNEYRGKDGYNWGYDPYHYTTPEGSYSTNPDGPARILEFRQMVQALNKVGLRVVMDVVYNHTNASGQSEKSVLDKIVPGYYHRLDANGNVTNSTCCANTATENAMMQKLMVDSLLVWARDYKVDGFRFDLMGHHMKDNMLQVREALDNLSVNQDGVDGKSIYIYGEGWNFGEVADNARGINATQQNLAGTGIGTFNDRIRDAARGGNPFGGLQEQGFINGLFTDPNEVTDLPKKSQIAKLLELSDHIRIGLAGNLANYELVNAEGIIVKGAQLGYNGAPAGYTLDPQENIVYVSAHDNETLFDAIQYKAPLAASMEDRVRMQNMGLSLVALSQGVPFFHAGSELLRSKSMDRDSYDSGDWFNRLDYTYQTNNWGVGLPPADKNSSNYPIMSDLLGNPELKPTPEHIQLTLAHLEEMLRIRKSSPLFRLQTAEDIQQRVRFYNTGPYQTPGLIIMGITDQVGKDLDANTELIMIVFNASPDTINYSLNNLIDPKLELHPVLANSVDLLTRSASFDPDTKTFTVPGRTTAVFTGFGRLSDVQKPASTGLSLLPWIAAGVGAAVLIAALWIQLRRSTQETTPSTGFTH